MTPTIKIVLSLGLAAFVAGCGRSSNVSKDADHSIANANMESMLDSKPDNPVHTIVMPHDEPPFPPGPGRDEFVAVCVVCHATWLSEVKKMKDVYGAHISDEEVLKITDYLVSINGKADSGQAPKGTYGE